MEFTAGGSLRVFTYDYSLGCVQWCVFGSRLLSVQVVQGYELCCGGVRLGYSS